MLPVSNVLLPTVSRFLDDDWNSLFDWSNRNFSNTSTTLPAVNIRETADEFIVEMAAPGMKKEDFLIELNNGLLSIRSERKNENEEKEEGSFTRKEFSYQSFHRSFNLNQRVVDDSKIKASYADGILRMILPKQDNAKTKPARQIKLS